MRTSALFLTLFACCFTCAAQYQWSNPQPSGFLNYKVLFVNADSGFIINMNSDVLSTGDRGAHWKILENIPTACTMEYFDSTAVVGAFQSVYIANGANQTWIKRSFPYPELVNHIEIVSRDTIFAVTTDGSILSTHFFKSVNRGVTWQEITVGFAIKSFDFIDSRTGYATSYAGVYKTTDGGLNWQLVNSTANFHFVKFNGKTGFAFTSWGVARTTDGGVNWSNSNPTGGNTVLDVFFTDSSTAFVCGENGTLIKTTDKGATWQNLQTWPSYAYSLYSLSFVDQNTGFAVGHRGRILKTTDAGATWTQYSPTYLDVEAIDFATDSIGFFTAASSLYKTSDAGQKWQPLSFPLGDPNAWFDHVHFLNKDTGFVISHSPLKVFKTYDGGSSWSLLNLNSLYNDYFLGAAYVNNTIFLSTDGAYGRKILRSKDGGSTWNIQNTEFNTSYKYPVFVDEATGYSVNGYNIYKSSDSGKTWTSVHFEGQGLLNGLWFVNNLTGYAFGSSSYLARTNDSGHTWQQLMVDPNNANLPGEIKDIRFFNRKIGFLLSGREIYRTVTGGNSWKHTDISAWDLRKIEMTNDSIAYFTGIYGTVLKKNMVQYDIDSLGLDSVSACGARIFASFTAVMSKIDSIWLQYGTTNYSNEVLTTPFSVNDTVTKIAVKLNGLTPHTSMKARFKIYYKGNYYYSDSVSFTTETLNTPTISNNNGILSSSMAQGNQWFLNGVVIPGATSTSFTPTQTGTYTVQATINGCLSPMSSPYNYVVTAINDPSNASVKVFPNPVTTILNIQNEGMERLNIHLYNTLGIEISEQRSSKKNIVLNVQHLPAGTYLLRISNDKRSLKYVTVIKL